ncbi:hypothetical protein [Hyphococcus sp.]|uniref:hypothetical protein n=1 Tax=Hyphococcus sp. TaxID=2038636 RepID=UPI0035C76AE6
MKNTLEQFFATISPPAKLIITSVSTGFTGYVLEAHADHFFQNLKQSFPFVFVFPLFLIVGGFAWAAICGPRIGIAASLAIYLVLSFVIFLVMRAVNF